MTKSKAAAIALPAAAAAVCAVSLILTFSVRGVGALLEKFGVSEGIAAVFSQLTDAAVTFSPLVCLACAAIIGTPLFFAMISRKRAVKIILYVTAAAAFIASIALTLYFMKVNGVPVKTIVGIIVPLVKGGVLNEL